jgi:hypothetical protein
MNVKIVKLLNYLLAKDFDPEDISEMYKFMKNELNITNSEVLNIAPILYRKYYPLLDDGEDFRSIENMNVDYDEEDIADTILALSQHLEVHPLTLKTMYNENYIEDTRNSSEYLVGDEDKIREIFYNSVDDRIEDLKEYSIGYVSHFLTLDEDYVEQFANDEARYRYEEEEPEEVIAYLNQQDEHEKWMERLEEAETEMNDVDNLITDLDYDIENETGEFSEEELENMEERRDLLTQRFTELETFVDNWDDDEENSKFVDTLEDDYIEEFAKDIYREVEREGIDYFTDNYGYSTKEAIDNFFDIDEDELKEDLYDTDRAAELAYYDGDENEEEVNGEYYYIYRQG